ncbi:cyclic nucleotide-binding domain-containing protein [Rhizobium sp. RU36D]|uniref:cyclic nucleotide-binding domain-containing protein n=1 Tax=Rhizobium sp. RU36D TaxID=1907415 RepID=UPI0009D80AB8|nr:cyclic nucleotide-binding domain-containing protein [Rhizobium sp. RU36D]SMC88692.1 Cyclic nucleotide-binding domain-containing protein [Rhizobium sp. RU36D]
MAVSDDVELLAGVPLFKGLNGEQLRLIAFGAEHRRLRVDDMLFRQGEEAECAYVVASGRLDLYVTDRLGEHHLQARAGRGTMLSELALATSVERKFTAVASEDSDVMRISRPLFHRLIEEYPDMATIVRQRIAASLKTLASQAAGMQDKFR